MFKKLLKLLLVVALAVVAILLILPAFLPKTYDVKRSLAVSAPGKTIYKFLGDFEAFNTWQPWIRMEPEAKKSITGKAFTVGHQYVWEGKKLGKGSMTLTALKENESVTSALDFGMGGKDLANSTLSLKEDGTQTLVTWQLQGKMGYFGRLFGLMMDRMIGPDFDSGLKNLKALVEKRS